MFQVIQRLSDNDGNLLSQMCDELNNVICKGPQMDKMIQALLVFIEEAKITEQNLLKIEGKNVNG